MCVGVGVCVCGGGGVHDAQGFGAARIRHTPSSALPLHLPGRDGTLLALRLPAEALCAGWPCTCRQARAYLMHPQKQHGHGSAHCMHAHLDDGVERQLDSLPAGLVPSVDFVQVVAGVLDLFKPSVFPQAQHPAF